MDHGMLQTRSIVDPGPERFTWPKEHFLALLSHELRTPLQAVMGWVQLLEGECTTEIRLRAIKAIGRNTRAMARIVDDLSDQARIASGKLTLAIGTVDSGGLLRDAINVIRPAAVARGIKLVDSVAPTLPSIEGDRGRLLQVFLNLLSNAVKFTPPGGTVAIEATATECELRVVVTDTGRGIEPSLLPMLFDRFRQAREVDAGGTGLGLGLSLVQELVERHRGQVRAHSDGKDCGATFVVTLPVLGA